MTIIKEKYRQVYKKLLELPPSAVGADLRVAFLRESFDNSVEYSCFVGFAMAKLSSLSQDEAIGIMSDIAIAALSVSRAEMMKRTA